MSFSSWAEPDRAGIRELLIVVVIRRHTAARCGSARQLPGELVFLPKSVRLLPLRQRKIVNFYYENFCCERIFLVGTLKRYPENHPDLGFVKFHVNQVKIAPSMIRSIKAFASVSPRWNLAWQG